MLRLRVIAVLLSLAWVALAVAPGAALALGDDDGPPSLGVAGHFASAACEDPDVLCDLDSDSDGIDDDDPDEDALPAASLIREPGSPALRVDAPPLRGRDPHPTLAPVFRPPRLA